MTISLFFTINIMNQNLEIKNTIKILKEQKVKKNLSILVGSGKSVYLYYFLLSLF